jgi:hypothetical protein
VLNCEKKGMRWRVSLVWYTSNEYKKKTFRIVIQKKYAPIIRNKKLTATF